MDKVDTTISTGFTPATAQEIAEVNLIVSINKAKDFLDFHKKEYSGKDLLSHYKELDDKNIKNPKHLVDSKNILHHVIIEDQVAKTGKFTVESPFGDLTCIPCSGAGERFKFFYQSVEVDCKNCDKGELIIKCKACKGTGTYINPKAPPDSKGVPCIRCNKEDPKSGIDPETGKIKILVGKKRVVCRSCRGTGRFKIFPIDSHIKSTTPCKHCKGKGFIRKTKKIKQVDNPVIPAILGQEIKKAVAQE